MARIPNPFAPRRPANRAPASNRAQERAAPWRNQPGSRRKPDTLDRGDFVGGQSYVANREYKLATFTVPRNEVMQVQARPFRVVLKAKVEGSGTNDASSSEQIDLGSAHSLNAIRTSRGAPSLPTDRHPDVIAFTTTDGGSSWTRQNITAFDAEANTVTIAKPTDTAYDYKIYVVTGNGRVRLLANAPSGSGALAVQLDNSPLAAYHEVDFADATSALILPERFGDPVRLSQKFEVGIYVTTDVEIPWTSEAEHEIAIPVYRRAVEILDARGTVRQTLQALGV